MLHANTHSYGKLDHCKIETTWEHLCQKKTDGTCFLHTRPVQTDPHSGTLKNSVPILRQAKISLIGHLRRAGQGVWLRVIDMMVLTLDPLRASPMWSERRTSESQEEIRWKIALGGHLRERAHLTTAPLYRPTDSKSPANPLINCWNLITSSVKSEHKQLWGSYY